MNKSILRLAASTSLIVACIAILPACSKAGQDPPKTQTTHVGILWPSSSVEGDSVCVRVFPSGTAKLLDSFCASYPAESLEINLPRNQAVWLETRLTSSDPTLYTATTLPTADPLPIATLATGTPQYVSIVSGNIVTGHLLGYEPIPEVIYAATTKELGPGIKGCVQSTEVEPDGSFSFAPAPCGDVEFFFYGTNSSKTTVGSAKLECGQSSDLRFSAGASSNFYDITFRVHDSTGQPFSSGTRAVLYLANGTGEAFNKDEVAAMVALNDGVAAGTNIPEGLFVGLVSFQTPGSGEQIERRIEAIKISNSDPVDLAITYAEVELEREHNAPFFGVKAFEGDAEVGGVRLISKGDRAFLLFDKPGVYDIELKTVAGPKRLTIEAPEGYSKYSL